MSIKSEKAYNKATRRCRKSLDTVWRRMARALQRFWARRKS